MSYSSLPRLTDIAFWSIDVSQLQSMRGFSVELMAGPPSACVTVQITTEQREISQAIQYLVTNALIRTFQLVIAHAIFVEYQKILGRDPRSVSVRTEVFDFRRQDKRSGVR